MNNIQQKGYIYIKQIKSGKFEKKNKDHLEKATILLQNRVQDYLLKNPNIINDLSKRLDDDFDLNQYKLEENNVN